jgi:hypothetical protein
MDVDEPAPTAGKLAANHETRPETSKRDTQDLHGGHGSDDDLGEFEFRLFGAASAPSKVILEDETAVQGEGALAHKRPLSCYLAGKASGSKKQEYLAAAVAGEDIVDRSRWPSWGMELPWKVTHLIISKKPRPRKGEAMVGVIKGEESDGKRKRPGKKRRIAVRIKVGAKKEKDELEAKKSIDKEEHLKEKKKRMNRLKKMRKRAKKKTGKNNGDDASEGDSGGE